MTTQPRHSPLVEAMAKHLPPSASQLRLLDVNGESGETLAALRDDLHIMAVGGAATMWDIDADSIDAVVALDYVLNAPFMAAVLRVMRPGGRLIVVDSQNEINAAYGKRLESNGYTRILVEAAVTHPQPIGVLMRGEKPHTTSDTLSRIQQVAGNDGDSLDLSNFKGRYVHLLVLQTPNKPVWRMSDDEEIRWQALAVAVDKSPMLLAFSSLPKAVGFMQPAVVENLMSGINKVGKFSKQTAATWTLPVLFNPPVDVLRGAQTMLVDIDPQTAEAPDE